MFYRPEQVSFSISKEFSPKIQEFKTMLACGVRVLHWNRKEALVSAGISFACIYDDTLNINSA